MKRKFYTEAAYLFGLILLAFGAAMMERADLGMSMVVAPAYLVYLKVSAILPWFSFGMAEYCFQALLLLVLAVVLQRFQRRFLFSFVTAFVYGNILDAAMKCIGLLPGDGWGLRLVFFVMGMLPASFMLPVTLKYGMIKGRTAYMVCLMVLGALVGILGSLSGEVTDFLREGMETVLLALMVLIPTVLFAVSWMLSVKFYEAREL